MSITVAFPEYRYHLFRSSLISLIDFSPIDQRDKIRNIRSPVVSLVHIISMFPYINRQNGSQTIFEGTECIVSIGNHQFLVCIHRQPDPSTSEMSSCSRFECLQKLVNSSKVLLQFGSH